MLSDDSREYDNNNNDKSFSFTGVGDMSFLKDPPTEMTKTEQRSDNISRFNEQIKFNEMRFNVEEEKFHNKI